MDQALPAEINSAQEIAALEQQISAWLKEESSQSAERCLALYNLATFTLISGQYESYVQIVARSAANPPPEDNKEDRKSWAQDLEAIKIQCTVKARRAELVEETMRTRSQENPQYRQANLAAQDFLKRFITIKQRELGERPRGDFEQIVGQALLLIINKTPQQTPK